MKYKLIMFLFLIFLIPSVDAVDYPSPNGYVNDFANMIDPDYEARLNREIMVIEETTTVEPHTYYIDIKARNLVLFLIFISLIIFIKFIKDARQSWIFLLVFDTILLIGTYLYSEGLFIITAFILFFVLLAVVINPINVIRSFGGFRGILKGFILPGILGGILGGILAGILGDIFKGRFKGRFGGGRSGGGGFSGKW